MRHLSLLLAPLLATAALQTFACGGNVAGTGGTGNSTATGGSTTTTQSTTTATGTGGGGGGDSSAGCPSTAPTVGGACTHAGAVCTYGSSVFAECHETFVCSAGGWTSSTLSCDLPSPGCPATDPVNAATCDADAGSQTCGYPDGQICICAPCPPVGPACQPMAYKWYCGGPAGSTGCPPLIPNEGSTCTDTTLKCKYPSGCGYEVDCVAGSWTWMESPCPG